MSWLSFNWLFPKPSKVWIVYQNNKAWRRKFRSYQQFRDAIKERSELGLIPEGSHIHVTSTTGYPTPTQKILWDERYRLPEPTKVTKAKTKKKPTRKRSTSRYTYGRGRRRFY